MSEQLHVVAVHLKATGGKRWYRSMPRSLSEAMAEHAQFIREGFVSRVEAASKADLALVSDTKRAAVMRRAKQRTRQLQMFEDA